MLKYWINRVLGRPTVRYSGQGALLYRENHRTIRIGVQHLQRVLTIDIGSIISWDDKPEQVLHENERRRIADAVKSVLESQWGQDAEVHEIP